MQLLRDFYPSRVAAFLRKYIFYERGKIRRLEEFLLNDKKERMTIEQDSFSRSAIQSVRHTR